MSIASVALARAPSDLLARLHGASTRMKLVIKDADGREWYLTWYRATRHTFASHYMTTGGDLATPSARQPQV
jgi:hypothetical protein